jgi:hypothetical protein
MDEAHTSLFLSPSLESWSPTAPRTNEEYVSLPKKLAHEEARSGFAKKTTLEEKRLPVPRSWDRSSLVAVTEPPRGGVRRQDQLERFSVKREHNQHT